MEGAQNAVEKISKSQDSYRRGEFQESIEYAKEALSSAKEEGNKEREAEAYDVLASSYNAVKDYKQSIEYAKEAVSSAKELGK